MKKLPSIQKGNCTKSYRALNVIQWMAMMQQLTDTVQKERERESSSYSSQSKQHGMHFLHAQSTFDEVSPKTGKLDKD